ncbi:MarR family transcriptional regulator [Streptococcus gordonii]|mgnify:FL=1|uniref:MarR family winged helix-turn-helix transcriptional regulator n=1 Tax=Streptococcus TaxID=1301 RepID=UPI0008B3865D|nr:MULTISPECIES: MarR family transcriptional regulator [Streptococcus]ATF65783.1 MarR family transcriptional regulator [Streptococcus gordonii]MCY7133983.1 MarR family transcriptional regulator [Streptococcus gordonii]OFL20960.1 transcriptional regulator [Streptococcus sp. HMSC062B01]
MDKKEFIKFNNRFNRFILTFEQLKKNQHKISIDKSITLNEVHLIVVIGKNQPLNLVKLSELLKVSRSAITQSVRRLIQKNLVVFDFAPNNGKNKYLRLSEKGIEVFKIHKEQQAYIEESVFSVLNNYSEEELQTVVKLMDDIENIWGGLPW